MPRTGARTPFRIIAEVMREPMLMLLAGGGIVYLLLGDLREALSRFLQHANRCALSASKLSNAGTGTMKFRRA